MKESPYFRAVQTMLHGAGVPYGYAVCVWSTGAALAGEHGVPTEVEILLFAAGHTGAYGGLRLLTWETGGEAERPIAQSPNLVRAGAIHLFAIGAAITAALLIAEIPGRVVWLLGAFAATILYLGLSSVEPAIVEHEGGAGG